MAKLCMRIDKVHETLNNWKYGLVRPDFPVIGMHLLNQFYRSQRTKRAAILVRSREESECGTNGDIHSL
jgi:hypothetical protein